MVLTAFCLAYAGLAALSLAMDRHYEDVFRRALTAAHRRPLRAFGWAGFCLLYTSPSPRDRTRSRMPSSA